MQQELIQMTRDDLRDFGRHIAEEVSKPLLEKINHLQTSTDVVGLKNIAKTLGCNTKTVSELIRTKALGRSLWKNITPGKSNNGKVILDRRKGVERYRHYSRLELNVKEALSQLSEKEIEEYYKQQQL